jgi:hypothetical protein
VAEGSTEVDFEMDSEESLAVPEVRMHAASTARTTHDPNGKRLVQILDVG